ncbi:MAG: phosphate ABC transporter substrate-binding protein PstS [Armatimonadetes bacterium]|nr:phosphate ABC transporter substrate-binding protein PstS [Armatimonadota bacterium]
MRTVWVMLLALAVAACARSGQVRLNGAGATFPYPLYSRWVEEYKAVAPDTRINYQSIGSGGGIRQLLEGTVDFGASDAPMNSDEFGKAPGPIVHIPTTLGAVVVVYNVPQVKEGLKLTPELLAGIFLGRVKTWNDPALVQANPGEKLPDLPIAVVHRSDGSGTTAVFTEYLAAVSPDWKAKVGVGKSVEWPLGLGGKGNEGVTGQVKTTPGALGYTELAYARQTQLAVAQLRNRAGRFVTPAIESISAAAAGVKDIPEDLRVSIVDAPGDGAYPISAFTYILAYEEQPDPARGAALAKFLWWAVHEGQRFGPDLDYAPLPPEIVKRTEARLRLLKSAGKPLVD